MQSQLSSLTATLYKTVLKPVFFQFDPEAVHNLMVRFGKDLATVNGFKKVMNWMWAENHTSLRRKFDGITFSNPVGLSAGFDYNADLMSTAPIVGFGWHTIGTVTLESYEGNHKPRLARFPKSQALLVNKGLKNSGAKNIIKKLKGQSFEIPVGISISSTNRTFKNELEQINNIIECFKLFEKSSVKHSYYELNISCPNTFGGEPFTTPLKLERLMKEMDKMKLSKPLYVKMPIDFSKKETLHLLEVLDKHIVQGVIFGNLTKDKKNPDIHPDEAAKWQNMSGNVSGKPTWKRSNRCIQLTRHRFGHRFTIIGTGGIFNGRDALEKMETGADLVQLITGMIYEGPQMVGQINRFLRERI